MVAKVSGSALAGGLTGNTSGIPQRSVILSEMGRRVVSWNPQILPGQKIESQDLLYEVFKHLNGGDLARAACASKMWRQVAMEDSLWERPCMKVYPSIRNKEIFEALTSTTGFKRFYRQAQEHILCSQRRKPSSYVSPSADADMGSQRSDIENPPVPERGMPTTMDDLIFLVDISAGEKHLYSAVLPGPKAQRILERAPKAGRFSIPLYTTGQAELLYGPAAALTLLLGDIAAADVLLQQQNPFAELPEVKVCSNGTASSLNNDNSAWGQMAVRIDRVANSNADESEEDGVSTGDFSRSAAKEFVLERCHASWLCLNRFTGEVASLGWPGRRGGCMSFSQSGENTFKGCISALLPAKGVVSSRNGVARSQVEVVFKHVPEEGVLRITGIQLEICDDAQGFGSPVPVASGIEILRRTLRWQHRGSLSAGQALLEKHTALAKRAETMRKYRSYAWVSLCHVAIFVNIVIAFLSFWIAVYALITRRLPPQLGLNRLCHSC